MVNGVLNIDKPEGITSHDVVNRIRKLSGQKRVGHAGTLDPFATGVLLVGLGSATRLLQYAHDLPKTYVATFVLGATSDTDDITGVITPISKEIPSEALVASTLQSFVGVIEQVPPIYSAIKVSGKKLYELARAGKKITPKPRQVTIHSIKLLRYAYPNLEVEISCAAGTYIRAIARDLGETLKTGAYVSNLHRTAIGDLKSTKAQPLSSLASDVLDPYVLRPEVLVRHLPSQVLTEEQREDFRQGRLTPLAGKTSEKATCAVYSQEHVLLGIGSVHHSTLTPLKVLS